MKFYRLNDILKKHATYNVIFGERSNGKTYSVLEHAIREFDKNGSQLAIVRRWKEDITGRRANEMFRGLIANGAISKITKGKYTGITYFNGRFFLCNYDDDNKALFSIEDKPLAYTFALSESEHNKSISYPDVRIIMFDEFLTKHIYLNDEFVLFMETVSTIVRRRTDVQIFMLGNTVNKFCPYFQEMGLTHIQKMTQGSIDVYTYGDSSLTVAVEYCASMEQEKQNNFYFAFDNPKLHMITSGSWELGLYPHCPVKYKPSEIVFTYFIDFNGQLYQCEIVDKNGDMFTFIHIKTTELKTDNELVYSLDDNYLTNYNKNVLKPMNKVQERIKWFYVFNKVFYQNNDVGNAIDNYLKICKGGI